MVRTAPAEISRRQFLAAGGLTVAAACLVPRGLCAQTDDLVEHALKEVTTCRFYRRRLQGLQIASRLSGRSARLCAGNVEACGEVPRHSSPGSAPALQMPARSKPHLT